MRCNESVAVDVKLYDAHTCAVHGYDTALCLHKQELCPATN